jgi:hypothetical protein
MLSLGIAPEAFRSNRQWPLMSHLGQEQKFEETMKDYAFGSTRFDAITEN